MIMTLLLLIGCNKGEEVKEETETKERKIEIIYNEDISSTFELKKYKSLDYYFYTPTNPKNNMSLIVYLHNAPDKKVSVKDLLKTDSFPKYLSNNDYTDMNAYVIIPKIDTDTKSWYDIKDTLLSLIEEVISSNNINRDKVTLTGHSIGGEGTFMYGINTDVFKCLAPLSGKVEVTKDNINKLSDKKIWAFVGMSDNNLYKDSAIDMISKLNKVNDNAKITKYQNAGHFDVPINAYKDEEVIKWLVNCGE